MTHDLSLFQVPEVMAESVAAAATTQNLNSVLNPMGVSVATVCCDPAILDPCPVNGVAAPRALLLLRSHAAAFLSTGLRVEG